MSKLSVGYAKVDITPRKPVQLTGYGTDLHRLSDNVLDPLYATCLAFTDENGYTALVYTLDVLYCDKWMRPAISEAIGLPVEQIHLSATHTHSGPYVWLGPKTPPEAREYLTTIMKDGLIEAAEKALADRKPAEMYITETATVGFAYVRRYQMEDGTFAGHHYGNLDQRIVGHESDADDVLQMVKFVREGGKDVVIANFGVHTHFTGGDHKYNISADVAGAMRAKMELALDCRFAYFAGAAGNIDPVSRIKTEPNYPDHIEFGRALADCALKINDTYRKVAVGPVKAKAIPLDLKVDHSLDYLEDIAREIVNEWKKTGDRMTCNQMCYKHGLHSVYHAESIIDKLVLGETMDIELGVISVGDVAFVMMPYEVFDTNAMFIKENSPFEMNVIATCCNLVRSYIPSAIACEHGGYSVDRCRYVPGTAEYLADEFVSALKELHEA